eukprot:6214031-Pleurochrysis_carterae.AAC.2
MSRKSKRWQSDVQMSKVRPSTSCTCNQRLLFWSLTFRLIGTACSLCWNGLWALANSLASVTTCNHGLCFASLSMKNGFARYTEVVSCALLGRSSDITLSDV